MIFRLAKGLALPRRHSSPAHSHKPAPKHRAAGIPLCELRRGHRAVIADIELTGSASEQIMLFGFLPGTEVVAGHCGLGGDPRVYRLDGTEVAIRRETARHILVRPVAATGEND